MNRELYIHTLRMLREQYEIARNEIARIDTFVETIDAALAEFERPTDSDCISRRAAIDAVRDRMGKGETNIGDTFIECFEMILNALPSAQSNTHNTLQSVESVGDTISRQAAIDEIDEWIKAFRENGHKESAADARLIQDGIIQLPSAQPEPQWIPCSERLPHGSCSDLVNVSIHDDSGDTPFDYTSCGWVTTDGEYWIVDNEINNHVIAWMPLPEPWRGEEP